MRITGGELRGRVLASPDGADVTRPMPDRVKVALFNILRGHFEGQRVLDLFAGSGAVGLEAISRGAAGCVFFDRDRDAIRVIEQNVSSLGVGDRCVVVQGDSLGPLALAQCPKPVHVIFCDPPYALVKSQARWGMIRSQVSRLSVHLDPGGFIVLRTPWPARHFEDADPAPVVIPARRKATRVRERFRLDDFGHSTGRGGAEFEDSHEPAERAAVNPVAIGPVDLEIAGLRGPETRTYGSMALHLYSRG